MSIEFLDLNGTFLFRRMCISENPVKMLTEKNFFIRKMEVLGQDGSVNENFSLHSQFLYLVQATFKYVMTILI